MKTPQIGTRRSKHENVIGVFLSINPDRQAGMRTAIARSRIYAYVRAARHQRRAIVTELGRGIGSIREE